jgi:hypothetical protein
VNGDSSQVTVEYTLKLRVSGNLPLKYTLAEWIPEGGSEHYEYFSTAAPLEIISDNHDSGAWYEYSFIDSISGGESAYELQGGTLNLNSYLLIIEWPVADGGENMPDTNSPVYMKEVELMEILASVSSKNMLDEYESTTPPDINRVYSTGIIILDPNDTSPAGAENEYTYDIDYRGFAADNTSETTRSFTLDVENGINKHRTQNTKYIRYDMLVKIPVNQDTQAYDYTLYSEEHPEGIPLNAPIYCLYNELDGSIYEEYDELPAVYPEGKSGPEYRMYAVYQLASRKTLVNSDSTAGSDGNPTAIADGDAYRISVTKPDMTPIAASELDAISFDNKLEVIVKAAYVD